MKLLKTIGEGVVEEDSQEGVALVPLVTQKDLQIINGDDNSISITKDKQQLEPLSA